MGTRSNVIRVWGNTTKTTYVHYDGYTENMLPQLARIPAGEIMKNGAWACLDHTGRMDASPYAMKERKVPGVGVRLERCQPLVSDVADLDNQIKDIFEDSWIEFVYVLTGTDTVDVYTHDDNGELFNETHSLKAIRAEEDEKAAQKAAAATAQAA